MAKEKEVPATSPAPAVQHEKKVPLHSAMWLAGADSMCGLLCGFAEGGVLTYFFVYFLGLNWGVASIVWILFGIWNAVNDPLYGFIADHGHHKLGRRIPWIRFGAPVYTMLFILTWVAFPSMRQNQVFLGFQMAICLFFFDMLYTAIASAIYVMPYEMAVTNKARSPIFIWKIVFSIISTGVPMFVSGKLNEMLVDMDHYMVFFWIMCGLGIVAGVVIFASTFFYKENGYVKEEEQPKFWVGLWACLKNKSFLLFEVISFTVIFAQANLMNGLTAAWAMWGPDWLGKDLSQYICLGTMVVGAAVGVVFDSLTREKIGAKKLVLVMCAAMALGCFLGAFLGRYFPVTIAAFFLIGIGFAGGMYLIPVINGDVIDKDEMVNGSRREGVYAGVNSLITKPAASIAQVAYMGILQAFGLVGSTDSQGQILYDWAGQDIAVKNGFFYAWMLIPAILLTLSFVAMIFFPLDGKKWNEDKAALAKRHEEKEAAFEQEILKKQAEEAKANPQA